MMRFLQALTRLNVVALAAIFGGLRGFGGELAYFGIVDRSDRQAAPKSPAAPPAPRQPLPSLSGPEWLQEALTHPHQLVRWSALREKSGDRETPLGAVGTLANLVRSAAAPVQAATITLLSNEKAPERSGAFCF
jgi:hypothetical protein